MKDIVMHIVGNRPQFIKLAPISKEIRKRGYKEIIIHTGQHYDENMSEIFFKELDIPKVHNNLNIGSGSHAQMTAKAMVEIEKVVIEYDPKSVIIYGDTNSSLAAALVCSKLNIPISHVEAGPRIYNKNNPEECNRLIIDHLSELLFCPDEVSVLNLKKEGITKNVYFTGDVMFDTFLYYSSEKKNGIELLEEYKLEENNFILMTWHRQENTKSKDKMLKIINFIGSIDSKIIFPIHPRTLNMLKEYNLYEVVSNLENIILVEPLGYLDMVGLLNKCKLVLTDSGGLSKESMFGGAKCLFMLDNIPWPNLTETGWIKGVNFYDNSSVEEALNIANMASRVNNHILPDYYGSGNAAEQIVAILEEKSLI